MDENIYLIPCPFCYSTDLGWATQNQDTVVCRACYARGPMSQDSEGAIFEWNRRQYPPDIHGRVWKHVDGGLNISKTSMGRFVNHCLTNNIEIGSFWPFAPQYKNSVVYATILIKEEQIEELEKVTKCKVISPPKVRLCNGSS